MSEVVVQERSSVAPAPRAASDDAEMMRVRWRGDDRFDIQVRDHVITVDQPVEVGGADVRAPPRLSSSWRVSLHVSPSTPAATCDGTTSTRRASR